MYEPILVFVRESMDVRDDTCKEDCTRTRGAADELDTNVLSDTGDW